MSDETIVEEERLLEQTDNGLRPEDGEQDVSQSPNVIYDEEGNEVVLNAVYGE